MFKKGDKVQCVRIISDSVAVLGEVGIVKRTGVRHGGGPGLVVIFEKTGSWYINEGAIILYTPSPIYKSLMEVIK